MWTQVLNNNPDSNLPRCTVISSLSACAFAVALCLGSVNNYAQVVQMIGVIVFRTVIGSNLKLL